MSSGGDERRRIGAYTAACVLVSNAVGTGIFTTTGFLARDIGDAGAILGLWLLGGLLSLAGALAYAELGAALPRSGGEYVYLARAYGPRVAFLSGWVSFTTGFGAAIAASAMGFAAFVAELVSGTLPSESPLAVLAEHPRLVALALVWSLTLVHLRGVALGASLQRLLTAGKIGGIVVFFAAALLAATLGGAGQGALFAPGAGELSLPTLAVSLVFVLYAFSGWNAVAYIAGEVREPSRSLPRALIGVTLFVTALYLAVNAVYLTAVPIDVLAAEPVLPVAQKAASALLGEAAAGWLSVLLCLSIAGAASAMIWVAPRVYREMAVDGELPAAFARDTRGGAPVLATLAQAAWVTLLVATGSFEALVVYSGVPLALFSALAVMAVVVLRVREPDLQRPYRAPFSPALPLAYAAACLGIAASCAWERPFETALALATIGLRLPVRALLSRRRAGRPRNVTVARRIHHHLDVSATSPLSSGRRSAD